MFDHRHVRFYLQCLGLILAAFVSTATSDARIIPARDPFSCALDPTVIAIVSQQSEGVFQVEEALLGDVVKGQLLAVPGFRMSVEDRSTPIAGRERIEPIYENTRILVFLKPTGTGSGNWVVAGPGNCYFWSHDPDNLESLRSTADSALSLRRSWEAARDTPDERQRAEALWPYLWSHNGRCYAQTEASLQKLGSIAGDYIAVQLETMSYRQKDVFLRNFGAYASPRLHAALVRELQKQQAAWEALLRRRGENATYEDVSPPRMRQYPRRPEDAEADEADDIYGVLYQGFVGIASFHDRNDLPFIRDAALWGVKYRFKQLCDAALVAFGTMPDKANLPVIQSIWDQFSQRPFVGNGLTSFEVMQALKSHRFLEAIPLMAQFVNVGLAEALARQFLVEMTGADFGGSTSAWIEWYESHKGQTEGFAR